MARTVIRCICPRLRPSQLTVCWEATSPPHCRLPKTKGWEQIELIDEETTRTGKVKYDYKDYGRWNTGACGTIYEHWGALTRRRCLYQLQSLVGHTVKFYRGMMVIQLAGWPVFIGYSDILRLLWECRTVLSAGMTAEEIILNGILRQPIPAAADACSVESLAKPNGILKIYLQWERTTRMAV